jgi:hypothetical protein
VQRCTHTWGWAWQVDTTGQLRRNLSFVLPDVPWERVRDSSFWFLMSRSQARAHRWPAGGLLWWCAGIVPCVRGRSELGRPMALAARRSSRALTVNTAAARTCRLPCLIGLPNLEVPARARRVAARTPSASHVRGANRRIRLTHRMLTGTRACLGAWAGPAAGCGTKAYVLLHTAAATSTCCRH